MILARSANVALGAYAGIGAFRLKYDYQAAWPDGFDYRRGNLTLLAGMVGGSLHLRTRDAVSFRIDLGPLVPLNQFRRRRPSSRATPLNLSRLKLSGWTGALRLLMYF